ncbi:hypothetical protein [Loktanella sp. SALINAS62]|uniref:hypothetical protein n=1 Tax=Loktanella sp. SALINAS62 TaxID=2706124 RepID=UPI001B8C64EE|nr:hypothetical protein [Loktanella sp. SALINAS62]MBS1301240.1 hypothetical protein [Loktanella sp. SALINAS62]
MKNVIKATVIAVAAAGSLFATTASAQTMSLLPVDRFVASSANSEAFNENLARLGVAVSPGEVLTGKDRDFAVRIMGSNVYDSTKAQLLRALYADGDTLIGSNGLY